MSHPIGTLCMITGAVHCPENIGKECTTMSPLSTFEDVTDCVGKPVSGSGYFCEVHDTQPKADNAPWFVLSQHLIRIDPDQDFSSEDEDTRLDKEKAKERELVYVEQ